MAALAEPKLELPGAPAFALAQCAQWWSSAALSELAVSGGEGVLERMWETNFRQAAWH